MFYLRTLVTQKSSSTSYDIGALYVTWNHETILRATLRILKCYVIHYFWKMNEASKF